MNQHQHILSSLEEGTYLVTLHARRRMAERNIAHSDIRECARTGKIYDQADGKFKVNGSDCDGYEISIICVEDNGVLVVTVF